MEFTKSRKNLHLEAVRGLAATLVVLGHLANKLDDVRNNKNHLINLICNWSYQSVLVFFILSGIVIHASIDKRQRSVGQFLKERIVRIHPILIFAMAGSIVMEIYMFDNKPTWDTIIGQFVPFATIQGYLVQPMWNANPVIWSLSLEMFFYVTFALCAMRKNGINHTFMATWFIFGVASIYVYYFPFTENYFVHYLTIMLVYSPAWIAGFYIWQYRKVIRTSFPIAFISLCVLPLTERIHITTNFFDPIRDLIFVFCAIPVFLFLVQHGDKVQVKATTFFQKHLSVILLTLIFICCSVTIYFDETYPMFSRALYIGIPFTVILMKLSFFKQLALGIYNKMVKPFFVHIGTISYSVYLVHNPILVLAAHYLHVNVWIQIALCFISTYLLSLFLEKKYQPIFNSLLKPKR